MFTMKKQSKQVPKPGKTVRVPQDTYEYLARVAAHEARPIGQIIQLTMKAAEEAASPDKWYDKIIRKE